MCSDQDHESGRTACLHSSEATYIRKAGFVTCQVSMPFGGIFLSAERDARISKHAGAFDWTMRDTHLTPQLARELPMDFSRDAAVLATICCRT
jgi:hypothetical protein